MTAAIKYSEIYGYRSMLITTTTQIVTGECTLEHIGLLSGGTAGSITVYDDTSAVAGSIIGGCSGTANAWVWEKGQHQKCATGLHIVCDSNVSKAVIVYQHP